MNPDQKKLEAELRALDKRAREKYVRRVTVHRELAQIAMSANKLWACKMGLYPLPEMDHMEQMHTDHPAATVFQTYAASVPGVEESILAAENYVAITSLDVADTPAWFAISEELTHSMLMTEVKGAYPSDIKMPFRTIHLELPKDLLYVRNPETGWHNVRWIAVSESRNHPKYGRHFVVVVRGSINENSEHFSDDHIFWFILPLGREEPVDELCLEMLERAKREAKRANIDMNYDHVRVGDDTYNSTDGRDAVNRLIINTLLYMNSADADVVHKNEEEVRKIKRKKGKKRKTDKRRIARLQSEREWLVGSRLVLDPMMKKAALGDGTGVSRTLRYKSLVRGHWRNQACGPGHKERRLIWIKPHVRGKGLEGKILGHTYDVV